MGRAQQRKKKGKERLDRYYHLAKEQGFRARSAFKLIQLAQKYDLFTNCRVAVDLCAAPGGWMQVCARHMPMSSLVIGVDLAPIQPIKGCTAFQGDITTQDCRSKLKKLLSGNEADLFLHDGSPNMGMDWSIDAFNQNVLVLHAAHLASEFLKQGGIFVSKVFRSSDYASLLYVLQQLFTKVEATKPQASRNVSAEIFVVCKGFRKPDKIDPRLFDPKFAFLSVDDEAAAEATQRETQQQGGEDGEGTEEAVMPLKAKMKLAEAFANSQKRRRGGYGTDETGYKALTLTEFFTTASPVEALLNASELKAASHTETTHSDIAQTVLSHRLTTPEIKGLWGDLKVLGKRELSQLLKWRFKIKRELAIQQRQERAAAKEGETEASGQDDEDDEEGAEKQIDEELAALHSEVSRQTMRQQRKATKKQKLLQTKQQFSRNAFSASERDPDLFACNKTTLDALAREEKMVDAQLLLTGGGSDEEVSDPRLPVGEGVVLSKGKLLEKEMGNTQIDEDDSDLDATDRMEIDLEVGLRLRALAQAERGNTKVLRKETRRARVLAERTEEMLAVTDDLQARALEHLAKAREADEEDSDEDGDEEGRTDANQSQAPVVHEYFDDEPPAILRASKVASQATNSTSSTTTSSKAAPAVPAGREAQAAARWFSQPLFSSAVDDVADTLLAEDFDPVVPQQRQQHQHRQDDDDDTTEIKELEDSQLPQIPLSEKQKKQQQRKKEELKKAAKEARGAKNRIDDDVAFDDKSQKIEEVPQATFAPPQDAEEAAELQAMGAMLIRRSSRMDLIDGAYNRYAFNDDNLPEWFAQDEEKHNKPELPVTKELMREYRQKMKEINSRPIRKVQEAKARKKKRALRVLEKVKRQAQGIADSSELSEVGKTKAIARLSKKAQQATARREKTLVVSRRVGGGKAAQKSQGKTGGARAVKLVDRRLKKDKRAMQRLQGKGGKKGGKGRKSAKKPSGKGRGKK